MCWPFFWMQERSDQDASPNRSASVSPAPIKKYRETSESSYPELLRTFVTGILHSESGNQETKVS